MAVDTGPASPQRIHVIRALALGDLLTAVPALRGLRRAFPEAELALATPSWLAPLIPLIEVPGRARSVVDRLVPTADLDDVQADGPAPDLVVNLHGSGPQSVQAALRLGAPRLLSYRHPAFPDLPGPEWNADVHEVERWCRLLRWAGLSANSDDLALAVPIAPPLEVGAVVVHPGASAEARRWPANRFGAVAGRLAAAGQSVLVTGSPAERRLAAEVAAAACHRGVREVAGRLRLDQLAGLIAAARLVICGDTGVAHLASAFRTPSVVLFGPTPPAWWGPPGSGPHRAIWHGRRGDPHAAEPDPGLLDITVQEVLAAANAAIDGLPRDSRRQSADRVSPAV